VSGRPWTRAERAILKRDYPTTENRHLAWRLKRSVQDELMASMKRRAA
jgi:hypothetical protein